MSAVLAASMVVGQAEGEKAFRAYADLMIGGVWTAAENEFKFEHSYQYMDGKQFLQLKGKGGPLPYFATIGIDPQSKKSTWWIFNEDGGVGKDTMTMEREGVWLLEGSGLGPDGKVSYKGRLTRIDENTLEEEVLHFKIGNEDYGTPTTTWRRK